MLSIMNPKYAFTIFTILILITVSGGCVESSPSSLNFLPDATLYPSPTPTPSDNLDLSGNQSSDETLRVGAFNIQIFGVTKASKPEVMDVLARIIRTYDVIAIQEIRDASQTALSALVDLTNSDGSQYDYVVSERLGRTTSREQYAYIYNTDTVEVTSATQTYPESDGTDPFHREPFIASFRALGGNFDATFIVIYTDPDEATDEINGLGAVVEYAQGSNPDEQDFIVMGDLNADGAYYDEGGTTTLSGSEYYWVIDNSVDTTTKSTDYTYDRIIVTDSTVSDLSGDSGVYRFDIEYGLSVDEMVGVSDHYPVYADIWCGRDVD